jgi:hypothetical protein
MDIGCSHYFRVLVHNPTDPGYIYCSFSNSPFDIAPSTYSWLPTFNISPSLKPHHFSNDVPFGAHPLPSGGLPFLYDIITKSPQTPPVNASPRRESPPFIDATRSISERHINRLSHKFSLASDHLPPPISRLRQSAGNGRLSRRPSPNSSTTPKRQWRSIPFLSQSALPSDVIR